MTLSHNISHEFPARNTRETAPKARSRARGAAPSRSHAHGRPVPCGGWLRTRRSGRVSAAVPRCAHPGGFGRCGAFGQAGTDELGVALRDVAGQVPDLGESQPEAAQLPDPVHAPQGVDGEQAVVGLAAPATSRRGHWMRRGEGTVIGLSTRDLRRAGVTLRSRLIAARGNQVMFTDNTAQPVNTVVWATGFHSDHRWIRVPEALDEHGGLRHNGGITPVPGRYVLGQPWQRTAGSALLGFVHHDAAYLAAHLTAHSPSSNR